jgi:hypothetical protein
MSAPELSSELFQAPADLVGKAAQRAIISIRERPIAAQPKLLSGDVTWCNSQIACATSVVNTYAR